MNNKNKMITKIDWNILNEYIHDKLIIANKHPHYNIWILNYTPQVQYEKYWGIYTLSCRGLIIDDNGNILARPFQKFFNYEEYDPKDLDFNQDFEVFEKIDGSLIILFYYEKENKWIFATRGSFIAEQSQEAKKIFHEKEYNYDILDKDYTYLFEVLYRENMIVIDYGRKRDLVLLSVINTSLGYEIFYNDLYEKYSKYFTIVPKLNIKSFNDLNELRQKNEPNREGFVIRFLDGLRIKMKLEEYVRLHSIVTNVSNLTIWRHLKDNHSLEELLDHVPDEFYNWVKKTANDLQNQYDEINKKYLKEFVNLRYYNKFVDRKDFAIKAKKFKHPLLLFAMLDGKEYSEFIWKNIRPIHSKPFRDGY